MKLIRIFVLLFFAHCTFAQSNFTGITEFTIGQETYEVDLQSYWLKVHNTSHNLRNTPIQADCYWYMGYDEVPLDFIATANLLESIIKNSLSPARRRAFARNNERLKMHIRFDNEYKIKEIVFDLALNTILTREEIHSFEMLLKNKTLIKNSRRNCNFNWLFFETRIDLF